MDNTLEILKIILLIITALTSISCVIKIGGIHILINSRMTELLKKTDEAARAEGKSEGKKEGN